MMFSEITHNEHDSQRGTPPSKRRKRTPFKLNPIIRTELSDHSLELTPNVAIQKLNSRIVENFPLDSYL